MAGCQGARDLGLGFEGWVLMVRGVGVGLEGFRDQCLSDLGFRDLGFRVQRLSD